MSETKHIGFCNICKTDNVEIVFQWTSFDRKHCLFCNLERLRLNNLCKVKELIIRKPYVRTKPLKQRNPISKFPSAGLKDKRLRDREVNEHIWATRVHECFECERPLTFPKKPPKRWFSHILGKGAHPELRFEPENIVLHCFTCHDLWEFGDRREMRTYWAKLPYMVDNGFTPKD